MRSRHMLSLTLLRYINIGIRLFIFSQGTLFCITPNDPASYRSSQNKINSPISQVSFMAMLVLVGGENWKKKKKEGAVVQSHTLFP